MRRINITIAVLYLTVMLAMVWSSYAGVRFWGVVASVLFLLWVVPQVLWRFFSLPKARARVNGGELIIQRGRLQRRIRLTEGTRVVKGLNSVWIIGRESKEVLQFSDFAEESVRCLKGLTGGAGRVRDGLKK